MRRRRPVNPPETELISHQYTYGKSSVIAQVMKRFYFWHCRLILEDHANYGDLDAVLRASEPTQLNRLNRSLTLFYVLLILLGSRTTLSAEPQDTYLIYHDIIRGLGRAEEANVRLKQIPVASEVGQTAFSLQMMTTLTVARNLLREARWFTMDNVTNLTSDPPGRTDPGRRRCANPSRGLPAGIAATGR